MIKNTLRLFDGYAHTTPESRAAVRELQNLLNTHGAALAEDGRFGPETQRAVIEYQKQAGQTPNGIAGPRLWAALLGEKRIKTSPPPNARYPKNQKGLLAQLRTAALYRPWIVQGADHAGVDPSIIFGIGSRESRWGLALNPPGPQGTGDAIPRASIRPWRSESLPPDGGGFGRGLMQIDYDAHTFARTGPWQDPRANIAYGCDVLRKNLHLLRSRTSLGEDTLLRAAIAAYNCGAGNVLTALRLGRDLDYFTAGRDYAEDVLERATWFGLQDWS